MVRRTQREGGRALSAQRPGEASTPRGLLASVRLDRVRCWVSEGNGTHTAFCGAVQGKAEGAQPTLLCLVQQTEVSAAQKRHLRGHQSRHSGTILSGTNVFRNTADFKIIK